MLTVHKFVASISATLVLASCITVPFNQEDEGYEITGHLEGKKSNYDEKIIVIGNTTGYKMIGFLSGHGPVSNFDKDSTSYEYFLEKNGNRVILDFLYRWRGTTTFDQIYNVSNQWFAFSFEKDSDEIEIYQFKYSEDIDSYDVGHDIDVHTTDAISELYISENASIVVWRDINVGYHEYNLKSKRITRRYFNPSQSEIDLLLKIPMHSAQFKELNFNDAIKSVKNTNPEPNRILHSQSPDILSRASKSNDHLIRWAVALNPKTSKDILEDLAKDKSYYVASTARKRLATSAYIDAD